MAIHRWPLCSRVIAALVAILATPAGAQTPAPTLATVPEARAEDVASLDAIMSSVYDVISGPAGQQRNWDRMRSLFHPGARLIPTGAGPDGKVGARVLTLEEYIQWSGPYLEQNGFFEREIGRVEERFGHIAHLMSAYESRHKADDPAPFSRGVNSFQLMHDGTRWWVVTIYWQSESPATPIPGKFLKRP
jgi:hypothetical protein